MTKAVATNIHAVSPLFNLSSANKNVGNKNTIKKNLFM
jgi:hypothetical protein